MIQISKCNFIVPQAIGWDKENQFSLMNYLEANKYKIEPIKKTGFKISQKSNSGL